ncbi:MAG: hypothetical protein ACKOAH_01385, partial [Pirellula sp.]
LQVRHRQDGLPNDLEQTFGKLLDLFWSNRTLGSHQAGAFSSSTSSVSRLARKRSLCGLF